MTCTKFSETTCIVCNLPVLMDIFMYSINAIQVTLLDVQGAFVILDTLPLQGPSYHQLLQIWDVPLRVRV